MPFTLLSSPAPILDMVCRVPEEPFQVETLRAQDSGWELSKAGFSKDFVDATTFNFLGHLKNSTGSVVHIFKKQRIEIF